MIVRREAFWLQTVWRGDLALLVPLKIPDNFGKYRQKYAKYRQNTLISANP